VIPRAVGIEKRRGDRCEVRFLEFLARLERLVEHGSGQQIPHLDADERLSAARRGRRDIDREAMVRRVFELEERLPFDLDGFDQSHGIGEMPSGDL
jgi:hypothetical protein